MKKIYTKGIFNWLVRWNAIILCVLTFSGAVKGQYSYPQILCYGDPINLFCGGLPGCGLSGSIYTWSNESGTWGSSDMNPIILPGSSGYQAGRFYVSVQFLPDGISAGTVSVILLPPLYISGTVTPVSCFGGNDGAVTLTPDGGMPGYGPFIWSNGSNNQNLTGVAAGTYTVTVTDANLCTAVKSFIVTQAPAITITQAGGANVQCNGTSTGYIAISCQGGTPSYNYLWNNGASLPTISGLTAGTYSVTVTDQKGCASFKSWSILQPGSITILNSVTSPACVGGGNGAIQTTVTGGTAPYTYLWSNGTTVAGISGLSAGIYSVTVTDSYMCTKVQSCQVVAPADLSVTGSVVNVNCSGTNPGSVAVTVSGGTGGPYVYLWNNGQTGSAATNLSVGTYTVTVTNGSGCTRSKVFYVSELTFGPVQVTQASCAGGSNGSVQLYVSGGTPPYSYHWSNGQISPAATGLAAGAYQVTITDASSCFKTGSWQVTSPAAISINSILTNVQCNGSTTGKIDLTVTGGTTSYSYFWNVLASQGQGTPHVSNLYAGTYMVTVTDNNFCTRTQSWSVIQPSALSASGTVVNVTCYGGSSGQASLTGSGGTPPYAYHWSNGSNNQTITGLAAGFYAATVTDAGNCSVRTQATISQASGITVSGTVTNINCQGGNTGMITTTVTGGSGGPNTYLWNNGQTGSSALNLGYGTYTVTVTNAAGCTKINSFTVQESVSKVITLVAKTNPLCFAGSDGAIQISVTGGQGGPYQYNWSNGETSSLITSLEAGVYTVTVTESGSCPVSASWELIAPAEISTTATQTNIACYGQATGKIDVTVSGGTPPYSYNWNVLGYQGQGTPHVSNLIAGVYTVTITDSHSCMMVRTWTITSPAALSANGVVSNVTCYQSCNGIATVTAAGGTPPYSYHWGNGSGNQTISGLCAGGYTVTITDANSCVNYTWMDITQPTEITIAGTVTKVSCQGGNNGKITTTVTGGTGGAATYLWNTGQTFSILQNLVAGIYTVTVTNAAGCTKSQSFTVTENPSIEFSAVNVQSPLCNNGSGGSIQITVTGGSAPYTYLWSNGQTTSAVSGLATGTYTVTVTDAATCQKMGNWQVTSPPAITLSGNVTNLMCNGSATGKVDITVAGGTPPYTYYWNVLPGQGQGTAHVSALAAGTYSVTVTDYNLCTKVQNWTVVQPSALSVNVVVSNVVCFNGNNGSCSITGFGGTLPYTYRWSTGGTGTTVTGLTAGRYYVTLTDANSCQNFSFQDITQPSDITIAGTPLNVICQGGNNGQITTTVTGGSGGSNTYLWSNGQTGATAVNLAAGNYAVTVTNAAGCQKTASWSVSSPAALSIAGVVTNTSCNGQNNGKIDITVTGGTSPYAYNWNVPANQGQGTPHLSALVAGIYTVTVTDNNLCVKIQSWAVSQPAALSGFGTVTNIICYGGSNGSTSMTVSGGTAPYAYLWSNGANTPVITGLTAGRYNLTVTDANSCPFYIWQDVAQPSEINITATVLPVMCAGGNNGQISTTVTGGSGGNTTYLWSNGQTSATASNLAAGIYTVTITNAAGCKKSASWSVISPASISVTGVVTNILCNGQATGKIDITATGGTSPYTYNWTVLGYQGQGTPHLSALPAGSYTVTITDINLCTKVQNWIVIQPTAVSANGIVTNVTCYGGTNGTATITAFGGTPPYTYRWVTGGTSQLITGLSVGRYNVTITDANLCVNYTWQDISQPSDLTINGTAGKVNCQGSSTGQVTTTVAGGSGGLFNYLWSNGQNSATASNLSAGVYTVTVTNAAGCTKSKSFTVTENPAISLATVTVIPVSCYGGTNGSVQFLVSGGVSPYIYLWSNGQTGSTAVNLSAGSYTVVVTDAVLCTKVQSWIVTQPTALSIAGAKTNVSCFGGSNGTASISASGGTVPYHYNWSTGATNQQITGLTAGAYSVTVVDANSCTSISSQTITQPTAITVAGTPVNVTCQGGNNGAVTTTITGGSGGPYNYLWNNGQTGSSASNLVAGTYTVTVTNGAGCTSVSNPFVIGYISPAPGAAGSISGPSTVNQGQTGVAYSVPAIPNATGYVWSLPFGASITSGNNTASILVNFSANATSGTISVYGTNSCDNGTPSPAFAINVIPVNLSLQNITLGAGTYCYNALQTISVAGNGTNFIVGIGAVVTMIAGQNILYLAGTMVQPGGSLHGYITTNGQYCTSPSNPLVSNPIKTGEFLTQPPEILSTASVRVYPNPAGETLTIEFPGDIAKMMTKVEIYNMNGVKVLSEQILNSGKQLVHLSYLQPGLYFIRITGGTMNQTIKLVKL